MPQESPSGVQGWRPGRESGGTKSSRSWRILKVVISKFYTFFVVIHTHEIETLIIENENYEAPLQSANSAPIRTTFIQRMKKWIKQLGPLMFMYPEACLSTSWNRHSTLQYVLLNTVQCTDSSDPRHFGSCAEVTLRPLHKMLRQFGTSAEMSQIQFGTMQAQCTTQIRF